ncbi:MAG: hypothetical protein KatS3mg108_3849 [Isosphaeraceae bacterium]|jgi:hypothetical protein|nr:MAG: hypothetical protein KatS3mg108_3849 [Isosphaeraceae bacterium]
MDADDPKPDAEYRSATGASSSPQRLWAMVRAEMGGRRCLWINQPYGADGWSGAGGQDRFEAVSEARGQRIG